MQSRRDFIKKGAYAAPVILSLNAVPAFAGSGSGKTSDREGKLGGRRRRRGKKVK
jgi:hypothetical protein